MRDQTEAVVTDALNETPYVAPALEDRVNLVASLGKCCSWATTSL